MKKIAILLSATVLMLSGCENDFVELDPLDSLTEEVYFTKPADFKAAANDFYNKMIGLRPVNSSSIYHFMDFGSDLTSGTSDYARGNLSPANADIYWTNSYRYIRGNNILLQKAEVYPGPQAEIAQYVAAAKFFRAWHHFFLLKRYGGVPIVTKPLDVVSPELYAPRNSRYEVMQQILADLTEAIPNLPLEQAIPAADKGQVSRWAAEAFKARVLLYEATWERYVGNTTDGDGVSVGAGSAGAGNNVEAYLREAVALAKDVMDNGGYQLWNYNNVLNNWSMYYLFSLEDAGSNPAGLDKSTNKEFILSSKYDYGKLQGGINLSHTITGSLAPNRKFMDMFLSRDGLPISQSPLFQGYQQADDEYQNRDYRLTSYFIDFDTDNTPVPGGILLDGGSGYTNRKFRAYRYGTYRAANTESQDYPQIRLAEVYLIYAEALYELNNSITDGQLNESINKTRARGGLPALTNAFAAANGLNLKEEIRRERAVELFGENTRFDDLKRWGIAEQTLNTNNVGSVIEGTDYQGNPALYNPARYLFGEITVPTAVGNRSSLLLDPASNKNFQRKHYLWPLPTGQIQINTNLLQNPEY